MFKNDVAKRYADDEDEKNTLIKVLDCAESSAEKNIPQSTGFMSETVLKKAQLMLSAQKTENYVCCGGYDEAERCVIIFLPDYMENVPLDSSELPFEIIRAEFRQESGLSHRDFLGALMGSGITRECIGDILVCGESCDMILLRKAAQYILANLEYAGRERLKLSRILPTQLRIPQKNVKEIKDSVSSLRLDSVVSSAFGIGRSEASQVILNGKVRVDAVLCTKPDRHIDEGTAISVRGHGKALLSQVHGVSKKGRVQITINRFI